jgi:DNA-binding CsgD family transcriptional regulator
MAHFMTALYLILFMSSSAGLVSLILVGWRLRSRTARLIFLIDICLTIGMLAVIVSFYLGNIAAARNDDSPLWMRALSIVSIVSQTAMYFLASRLVGSLKAGGRLHALIRRIAMVACYLVMAYGAGALTIGFLPRESPFRIQYSSLLGLPGMALVCVTMLLIGMALILAPTGKAHSAERLLLRGWAAAILAFVPLSILEPLAENAHAFAAGTFHMDFLFHFACDLISIAACVRAFRPEGTGTGPLAAFRVEDDTARRFGLTPRERDMAQLIARGLANKEIAAELGISGPTVRSHIYNLYQKVGARSRIELLNKLGS